METIGAAISLLEEQLFTGRQAEQDFFLAWLASSVGLPLILNVVGPGGVGKTTLLRAFGRLARLQQRPVVLVDGHDLDASPAAYLGALSVAPIEPAPAVRRPPIATTDAVAAYLNDVRPLLLVDTFEELGALGRYLREEFLPHLHRDVRVVIAGRYPLARAWGDVWSRMIRPIMLEGFTREDARRYLERRGITDQARQERMLDVTAGHPLALSLAADLALKPGRGDFTSDPSWKLATHELVQRLLRDVLDPDVRWALEAASVVRQFDEAMLTVILDRPVEPSTFGRLSELSFVRPAEHGLMLHEDVRRILHDDLRWRDKVRYDALRERALTHYRRRMHGAPPEELAWLVGERLFLWEDAFAQQWIHNDDQPGRLPVDAVRRELQALLPNWRDDDHLLVSPLADVLRDEAGQPIGARPELLRQAIRAALSLARESATVDRELAFHALELAYIAPAPSRTDAARHLAVSRRTFYRLLERGIDDLAVELQA